MNKKLAFIAAAVMGLMGTGVQAGEPVYKHVRTASGKVVLARVTGVAAVRTSGGVIYYRTGGEVGYSTMLGAYGGGYGYGNPRNRNQRYSLPAVGSNYGPIPRNFAARPGQQVQFRNYPYFAPGAYAAPVPSGIPAAAHGNNVRLGTKK